MDEMAKGVFDEQKKFKQIPEIQQIKTNCLIKLKLAKILFFFF